MRRIELTREISQSGETRRLVATVTEATGMDPNIFLYLALPMLGTDSEQVGVCQGVCSASDLADYPVGDPLPAANPPWFRANTLDYLFPSAEEMVKGWTVLEAEISALLQSLDDLDLLVPSGTFYWGGEPVSESESF